MIRISCNQLCRDKEQLQLKLQKAEKTVTEEKNKLVMVAVMIVEVSIFGYRCQSLKDEIRRLKKKEAADTKALEEIVQKVEKNLLVTTVSDTCRWRKYCYHCVPVGKSCQS